MFTLSILQTIVKKFIYLLLELKPFWIKKVKNYSPSRTGGYQNECAWHISEITFITYPSSQTIENQNNLKAFGSKKTWEIYNVPVNLNCMYLKKNNENKQMFSWTKTIILYFITCNGNNCYYNFFWKTSPGSSNFNFFHKSL